MTKWLTGSAKVLLALLISAAVWEGVLRTWFTQPIVATQVPQLGWLPKNVRGMHTYEGFGRVQFNEQGFRESSIGPRKDGETRLLVLGDSNIEARQVNQKQTMPSRLQHWLDASPAGKSGDCRVRVLNGGRVGATPAFHVGLAEQYKAVFQPDWVAISIEDDRWEMMLYSKSHEVRCAPEGDGFRIVTKWKKDSNSRLFRLLRKLHLRDTAVVDWSFSRLDLMNRRAGNTEEADIPASDKGASAAEKEDKKEEAKKAAEIDRVMDWTLQRLKEQYPRLVLVHVPSYNTAGANFAPVSHKEEQLALLCRRYNVPLIQMRERMTTDYAKTGQPPFGFGNTLPWTGHLNAHGHDVIAHAIADFFADKLCAAPATANPPASIASAKPSAPVTSHNAANPSTVAVSTSPRVMPAKRAATHD